MLKWHKYERMLKSIDKTSVVGCKNKLHRNSLKAVFLFKSKLASFTFSEPMQSINHKSSSLTKESGLFFIRFHLLSYSLRVMLSQANLDKVSARKGRLCGV